MSACSSLASMREQPLFLRTLGVAHQAASEHRRSGRARSRSRGSDRRARPSTPSRARETRATTPSTSCGRRDARAPNARASPAPRRATRDRRRPAGKSGVDVRRRMQRAQHARRAADVIGVRMRQHEHVERAAAPADVRHDRRPTRVAAAPRPPASNRIQCPCGVCSAIASPCPTSIMCSSTEAAQRRCDDGSQTSSAAASTATSVGFIHSRDAHATMTATDITPATTAAITVGATVIDPAGTAAAVAATRSRPTKQRMRRVGDQRSRADAIGASSMPKKIIGCASAISGAAARLVSGATTLTRPKTHATIGAEPIVATVVPISRRRDGSRKPRQPADADAAAKSARDRSSTPRRRRSADTRRRARRSAQRMAARRRARRSPSATSVAARAG